MPLIEQVGYYKAEIKDFAVSLTRKQELPQLVLTLAATEMYDETNETWDDWSGYGLTTTAYFVLVTQDEHGNVVKCLNYDQIMDAVGWDGETYSGLAAMDLKGMIVQIRVQEDVYNNNTNYKVNWIAAENAEIGLKKLSGKDLTSLDAKFGVTSAKPKTAVKPKSTKKTDIPKSTAPKSTTKRKPPVRTTSEEEAKSKPKKETKPTETCTMEQAFESCIDANTTLDEKDRVPDEILDDYWQANVDKIATDPDNPTEEEWPQIRNAVLSDIDVPF